MVLVVLTPRLLQLPLHVHAFHAHCRREFESSIRLTAIST